MADFVTDEHSAHVGNSPILRRNSHAHLSTVISGSYRKHLKELFLLKAQLESHRVVVLSPVGSHTVNPGEEFIILDADPISDHRLLQDSIFAKMRSSSFHVLANIDGHMGSAALIEVGYAIAIGLQILTLEPVTDPNVAPYCRMLNDVFPSISRATLKAALR